MKPETELTITQFSRWTGFAPSLVRELIKKGAIDQSSGLMRRRGHQYIKAGPFLARYGRKEKA
jgi:hypothetical protein